MASTLRSINKRNTLSALFNDLLTQSIVVTMYFASLYLSQPRCNLIQLMTAPVRP